MSSYQYLLSESQERMLFVVKEEKINDLMKNLINGDYMPVLLVK